MSNETICAISSPPGLGGIGLIRVSGPEALRLAEQVFRDKRGRPVRFSELPSHTVRYGFVVSGGRCRDEVLVTVLKGPRTYTREDMVEIGCHGGAVPLRSVLGALLDAGGRLAGPGEFTRRAFLAGRIDLAQAEAVLAAVNSRTEAGLEAALAQIKGSFTGRLADLERDLFGLLAGIEAGIEFPDELEPPVEPRSRWQADVRRLAEKAGRLRRASAGGRALMEGIRVVIAGRPNVGKSSLLNALLEQERAIVTDLPGTTRDEISELITLAGLPVRLTDTAGIGTPRDRIEQAGVRRSRARVKSADLVLLVLDRSRPLEAADRRLLAGARAGKTLLVLNKIDRPDRLGTLPVRAARLDRVEISARFGNGLDGLKEKITDRIRAGRLATDSETPVFLGVYQEEALRQAGEALSEAAGALAGGLPLDFVLASAQRAARHLAEISGRRVGREVLDQIFSRFCVGK